MSPKEDEKDELLEDYEELDEYSDGIDSEELEYDEEYDEEEY